MAQDLMCTHHCQLTRSVETSLVTYLNVRPRSICVQMPGIKLQIMLRGPNPLVAVEAECFQAPGGSALSCQHGASQAAGLTGSLHLTGYLLTQSQLHLPGHVRIRVAGGKARPCSGCFTTRSAL